MLFLCFETQTVFHKPNSMKTHQADWTRHHCTNCTIKIFTSFQDLWPDFLLYYALHAVFFSRNHAPCHELSHVFVCCSPLCFTPCSLLHSHWKKHPDKKIYGCLKLNINEIQNQMKLNMQLLMSSVFTDTCRQVSCSLSGELWCQNKRSSHKILLWRSAISKVQNSILKQKDEMVTCILIHTLESNVVLLILIFLTDGLKCDKQPAGSFAKY